MSETFFYRSIQLDYGLELFDSNSKMKRRENERSKKKNFTTLSRVNSKVVTS